MFSIIVGNDSFLFHGVLPLPPILQSAAVVGLEEVTGCPFSHICLSAIVERPGSNCWFSGFSLNPWIT